MHARDIAMAAKAEDEKRRKFAASGTVLMKVGREIVYVKFLDDGQSKT